VFCRLVIVRLSVPVQVIDWKDSSHGDVKPYSLTHRPYGKSLGMAGTRSFMVTAHFVFWCPCSSVT